MSNFIVVKNIANKEILLNIEKIVDIRNYNGLIGIFMTDGSCYVIHGDFNSFIENFVG